MGVALPGAGSSVTMIARTASNEPGTLTFAHARPLASTVKTLPETAGLPAGMNHSW